MKFPTQFDSHERKPAKLGNPIKTLYGPVFDANGVMSLEEKGKENLYAYIQSHKDSVDIQVLLQRYSNGDASALSKAQGVYGDFTNMPTTMAELLNRMAKGQEFFNGLPVEVRAKFNHSFSEFMAASDRPDFWQLLGFSPDPAGDPAPAPAPAGDPAPGGVSE